MHHYCTKHTHTSLVNRTTDTRQPSSLLHNLSSFGFYDTLSKLVRPTGMLLQLLDGRTDRVDEPQYLDLRSSSGTYTMQKTVSQAFRVCL